MAWLLVDRVSAAGEVYPAVAEYEVDWSETVTLEQRGKSVVRCNYIPAFDSDPRIKRITKALVAQYIPDDGESDGEDSAPLALKVVRRALLENLLGSDDFGDIGSLTVGDIEQPRRGNLIAKLDARGIDRSGISLSTPIADALRQIIPQIPARVLTRAAGQSGTFIDNFNGEASAIDLAARTPTQGTAWTRQNGAVNDIRVFTNGTVYSQGAGIYLGDDEGGPDQYLESVIPGALGSSGFAITRYSDPNNFFGTRYWTAANQAQLYTKEAGTFSSRGTYSFSDSAGDIIRTEHEGNATEVFLDTGSGFVSIIGPYNSTFNNTATRQGLGGSSAASGYLSDGFEAGLLSAPPASTGVQNLLIGAVTVKAVLLGSTSITKVYLGSTVVFSEGALPTTYSQGFTADGTFDVPTGVSSLTIWTWGAGGGGGGGGSGLAGADGGGGGFAKSTISVTPGETLYVRVGGGGSGAPAQDAGPGGGGGGYSGIFRTSVSQANALIVAGGGGGGGGGDNNAANDAPGAGGAGGGSSGGSGGTGQNGSNACQGGLPGTQINGGDMPEYDAYSPSGNGAALAGGAGGARDQNGGGGAGGTNGGGAGGISVASFITTLAGSGGGGAGYFGGSGGGGIPFNNFGSPSGGGGGGGSGYVTGTNTTNTQGSGSSAANSGDENYPGSVGNGGSGGASGTNAGSAGQDGYVYIEWAV